VLYHLRERAVEHAVLPWVECTASPWSRTVRSAPAASPGGDLRGSPGSNEYAETPSSRDY